MPTLKKNDKKPTKSSNEDRVAAMIASGKWKKGPNGELLRVSEDSNKEAYEKSLAQANKELQSEGLQPSANSSGFMTPERKAYLNNLKRPLTESEAREWATTSFDPSENPNIGFSLAAGFSAPVAAMENLALKPILSAGSKIVSGVKSLAKPSEALLDVTRGALQGSETTKASHQLFTDFIKKHHPETFSKLKAGTLDVADLASDPKYVDDFANRYSTTYRGVGASSPEEAAKYLTEQREFLNQGWLKGPGIYSSLDPDVALSYAKNLSNTPSRSSYVGRLKTDIPYKTSDDLWTWMRQNEQVGQKQYLKYLPDSPQNVGVLTEDAMRVTRPGSNPVLEDIIDLGATGGNISSIQRPTLRRGGRLIKKKSGGKFKLLKK